MAKKEVSTVEIDEDTGLLLQPYDKDLPDSDKVFYPTQFMTLNLCTGKNVRDPDTNEIISRARGIRSGGFILMSGRQSIGKTTLALNISGHIKQSVDSQAIANMMNCRCQIYYMTTEDGMEKESICKNSYTTKAQMQRGEVIIIPPCDVSTEKVADKIDEIAEWKEANKKNLMFPQPCVGGGTRMEYMPTILFIDSLTGLVPKVLKERKDNETNNVFAMTRNKENGVLIINKFEKLRKYNIITIWIVHVGTKVNIGMTPNQKDYQALSADYKVSDGKTPQFYADLFMFINKITDSDSKKNSVQDIIGVEDRFIGAGVEALLPKNRWGDNSERTKFRLVQDYAVGWNPFYSLLYELKQRDIVTGSGIYKYLEGYTGSWKDGGFKLSEIPDLLATDDKFVEAMKECMEKEFSYVLEAGNQALPRYKKFRAAMDRLL